MWTPRMTERHDAAAAPAASTEAALPSATASQSACPPLPLAASAPAARAAVFNTMQDAAAPAAGMAPHRIARSSTAAVDATAAAITAVPAVSRATTTATDLGRKAALCTLLCRSVPVHIQACQAALAQQSGLPLPELKAMEFLQEYHLLSTGDLGQLMGLSHGGVATLIDRLETAGLATRQRHPADRRIIAIRANPAQAGRLPSPRQHMQDAIAEIASRYSPEELEVIQGFLGQCGESLSRLSMRWLDQEPGSGDAPPAPSDRPARR